MSLSVEVKSGSSPIVLGLPHTGLGLPFEVAENLNEFGRPLIDTDWHIHKLYDDLVPDLTTVRTTIHRSVIDVNRDPCGESLYPGQNTTTLVPLIDFDGNGIWKSPPAAEDVEQRKKQFHKPYHDALSVEIERVKKEHGFAILYDCHSIRSDIPFLFDGKLPDFNIGTNNGTTCDPDIEKSVHDICSNERSYSTILNGRFKGGWTTRHYGRPEQGVHAIQMELAQCTYLEAETTPFPYASGKAKKLRSVLRNILIELQNFGG